MQKRTVPTLAPVESFDIPSGGGGGWLFVDEYDPTIEGTSLKIY